MATHSSIFAWKIPMDRGVWQATIHGGKESDMTESSHTHTHTHPHTHTHSSSIAGQQKLGGLQALPALWGHWVLFSK